MLTVKTVFNTSPLALVTFYRDAQLWWWDVQFTWSTSIVNSYYLHAMPYRYAQWRSVSGCRWTRSWEAYRRTWGRIRSLTLNTRSRNTRRVPRVRSELHYNTVIKVSRFGILDVESYHTFSNKLWVDLFSNKKGLSIVRQVTAVWGLAISDRNISHPSS